MSRKLTQKQENFCLKYIECGSSTEAYNHAYNTERMKPATINNNAYKLLINNDVATRVKELQEEAKNKALWTREQSIKILSDIAMNKNAHIIVDREGQELVNVEVKSTDKINAVKELNSMHGWKGETIDHKSSDGSMSPKELTQDELDAKIKKLLDDA